MFIEYRGKRPRVAASAFIAPTAVLIGDVEVGEEASVWFGVVIRADNGPIHIGARSSVQDNSVLHVSPDCVTFIGEGCTIGHSVTMEDCTIENGAIVGSNAVVLNGARVGRRSLVGAGSVVATNADIPPESVAAGSPATVKKQLAGTALEWIESTSGKYVRLAQSYLHHGIGDPEMQESIETTFAP
jgi:carbonic anhydrase/acetyltransferase-like protein (isoleucine patch superfamily)